MKFSCSSGYPTDNAQSRQFIFVCQVTGIRVEMDECGVECAANAFSRIVLLCPAFWDISSCLF
jgi:hypothetical protein